MLIESDIIIAWIKKEDWLKPIALEILTAIEKEELASNRTYYGLS